ADRNGGVLAVQVSLAQGWHTYSVTEAAEPVRTRITLVPSGQFRQAGAIRADVDPRRTYDAQAQRAIETHDGTITGRLPIRFAEGVDPARLQIGGLIELMVCNDQSCQPLAAQFVALYQADAPQTAAAVGTPAVGPSAAPSETGIVAADSSV